MDIGQVQLLVLGDKADLSKKTTLIEKFLLKDRAANLSVPGGPTRRKMKSTQGHEFILQIDNSVGIEANTVARASAIGTADCILLVFSANSKLSWTNIPKYRDQVLSIKGKDFPYMGVVEMDTKQTNEEAFELTSVWNVPYFEMYPSSDFEFPFKQVIYKCTNLLKPALNSPIIKPNGNPPSSIPVTKTAAPESPRSPRNTPPPYPVGGLYPILFLSDVPRRNKKQSNNRWDCPWYANT